MVLPAQEGQVTTAPGAVDRTCPTCGSGRSHGNDGDPRHVAVGGGVQMTTNATLPDGSVVPVSVRKDVAFHFDCHASMGCDLCKTMLAAHGGSVKGKVKDGPLPNTPDELVSIEPYEFTEHENGVWRRALSKEEAVAQREREAFEAGVQFIGHTESQDLHEAHSADKAGKG